jgi:putative ABC transport system permease protein
VRRSHPTLRRKQLRDIRGQWPQFAAITVTIMLGVALFSASYEAYRNLVASYDRVFADERFADLFVTGGDVQTVAEQAGALDQVAAVALRTQVDLPLQVGPEKLRGRVVGYPLDGEPEVNSLTQLTGTGLTTPTTALAEHHMADQLGVGAGDSVVVVGAAGPVTMGLVGTVSSGEYLWPARSRQEPVTLPGDFGVLFVPEATAQSLAGQGGPNQVLVRLTDEARAAGGGVLDRLARTAVLAGATEVLTRAEQPSNALLNEDILGFQELAVAFPALFLTAAALATYVLLSRRVLSERRIIGTLLASGMRRRTVTMHYLGYGLLAGLAGALLGVAVGAASAAVVSRFYLEAIGLPLESAVLQAGRATSVLGGLAFGVSVGAVAAFAPARLASRVPPAEAMRGETPAHDGHISLVERVLPPVRRAPVRWRMALRGIGRNRHRSAFTATGVALALILVLASWTMIDTMNDLLSVQFDTVARQDAQVDYGVGVGQPEIDALLAVDGVRSVETLIQVPVALMNGERTYSTALYGLEPGTSMHGFRLRGGATTTLPDEGLLVGQSIQDRIGVRTGDDVTVRVAGSVAGSGAEGSAERDAVVAGLLDEPLGTYAYASQEWIRSEFGDIPARSALVGFEPGADPDAVRRAISDLPGVLAYTDTQALARVWDQYSGLFYAFVGGMLVLGGVMAFAVIFTTMSVNILERRRDLATLRAAGVRYARLARVVATENMLVALGGVVPGVILGLVGGWALLASFSSDQFTLELVVRPSTVLAASAAILLVALASQWPGLRAVRRMDLGAVVRERGT